MKKWMITAVMVTTLWLPACSSGGGGSDAVVDGGNDAVRDVPGDPGSDRSDHDEGQDPGLQDEGQDPGLQDEGHETLTDVVSDQGIDAKVDAAEDTVKDTPPEDAGNAGPFGFTIRVPQAHEVECEGGRPGSPATFEFWDTDWICTLEYGGVSGHVYVQSTPVACHVTLSAVPEFTTAGAWISVGGKVTPISPATYDWGGNHHNDSLEVVSGGNKFKYYHSSFGFGWRKCQNMDCILVYDQTGADLVEDGCTKERTLPATCVLVDHEGHVPEFVDVSELPADQWPCPGDPNDR